MTKRRHTIHTREIAEDWESFSDRERPVGDFLEAAGTVPVPPEKRGMSWAEIRAEAWAKSTRDRR